MTSSDTEVRTNSSIEYWLDWFVRTATALAWPLVTLFIFLSLHVPLAQVLGAIPDRLLHVNTVDVGGLKLNFDHTPLLAPEVANALHSLSYGDLEKLAKHSYSPDSKCRREPKLEAHQLVKFDGDKGCSIMTELGDKVRTYLLDLISMAAVQKSNAGNALSN